jgi:hypothetical protein
VKCLIDGYVDAGIDFDAGLKLPDLVLTASGGISGKFEIELDEHWGVASDNVVERGGRNGLAEDAVGVFRGLIFWHENRVFQESSDLEIYGVGEGLAKAAVCQSKEGFEELIEKKGCE